MKLSITSFLATVILVLCAPSTHAAKPGEQERLSVASGQVLSADETPAGEAIMTVYHPEKSNGAAVVIYPGGGYSVLVKDPEGHKIARWLNDHGITGVLVEYRLPAGNSSVPLLDAQRATRIVRLHAKEWKCDPARIGNIGFSAGGHLASTAATHFDNGNPTAKDPIDKEGCRPDFSILVYPVITMGEKTHGGSKEQLLGPSPDAKAIEQFSNEKQVTAKTPPTFLVHAVDDTLVVPENSAMYYEALVKNKVPAEYLQLSSGGHGINGYQGPKWEEWKTASLKWLAKQKFIKPSDAN